ncbi:hypothetical protein EC957_001318 [Mortierella hygrophila]|uniref:LysM domain-containing protein n=1 Tax=Mortierella hygrophila TaxID=979708 RepID=A0A9P6K2P9_9FUNG|nr:hypothetical protein EC957_001318 [Mortierella hygrophila]
MKFTTALIALAAVASSAMAVVPIPVEGCQKTVVVKSTDTGCIQFAGDNGTTFANLLKWNNKLRGDCANLDVGHPLCVLGPKEPTTPVKKPTPKPTTPVKKPTPKPTKPVKKPTPKPTKPVKKPTPKPKKPTPKPKKPTHKKPTPKPKKPTHKKPTPKPTKKHTPKPKKPTHTAAPKAKETYAKRNFLNRL